MPTYTAKYLITDVLPAGGGPYTRTTINIAGRDWVQVGYQLADKGINKYVLQGLVDVSTLHGNERYAHNSWDAVGTTFYWLSDQTISDISDIPAEYRPGASAALADGWWGTHNTAGSGDFLWTSATTATYNLKTSLSLPGVRDIAAYGLNYAADYILGEAASTLGVAPFWDAVKRVDSVNAALTDFVNNGADTLNQLLIGFNTGMTPQKADLILQQFMDKWAFDFHHTAETVVGTGTGEALGVVMESLRLTEQWVVDPSSGNITHSRVGIEDGAHKDYYGQYSGWITTTGPSPWYGNDAVLAGGGSDIIDTGLDRGLTPRGQIDFVAAGGGADIIKTYEGADVISAGFGNDRIIAGPGNDYINGGRGFDTAYYTGAISDYSIVHNVNGSWTVTDRRPGSPDGTDTLISVEQLMFANGAADPLYAQNQSMMIATAPIPKDFNQDGFSDIQWRNDNGQVAIWAMNGTSPVQGGSQVLAANPGPAWTEIGAGDFNGDGRSDILWQSASGQVAVWEMNGANVIGGGAVGPNPGPGWRAVGTGDFNADSHSDILWQNVGGQAAIWEMNGTSVIGGGAVGPNPGPGWRVVGTGDFNADDHSDILWQNASGQIAIWEMNGTNVIGGAALGVNAGPGWKAVGTGDFNGDGRSDILLQNASNGQAAIWEMNGANLIGGGAVASVPGATWRAIGTSDFNGDGYSDILWQNVNGQAAIWEMNGARQIAGGSQILAANPGPSWHAVGA